LAWGDSGNASLNFLYQQLFSVADQTALIAMSVARFNIHF